MRPWPLTIVRTAYVHTQKKPLCYRSSSIPASTDLLASFIVVAAAIIANNITQNSQDSFFPPLHFSFYALWKINNRSQRTQLGPEKERERERKKRQANNCSLTKNPLSDAKGEVRELGSRRRGSGIEETQLNLDLFAHLALNKAKLKGFYLTKFNLIQICFCIFCKTSSFCYDSPHMFYELINLQHN